MKAETNTDLISFLIFQNLLSNLPMIFYALDEKWIFTLSEGKGLEKLGLKPGQVLGINAKEMYHEHPDIIEAIEEAYNGKSVRYEHQLGELYLENFIMPIFSPFGKVEGIIGATIDITERKKKGYGEAEEEMIAMNKELTAANDKIIQMKDYIVESEKMTALGGLVAGFTHEVNTPLGVGITASSHLVDLTKELMTKFSEGTIEKNELLEYLEDIKKASSIIEKNLTRAGKLIHSFKQLSVDQTSEPRRLFNVGDYLEEILISLSPTFKKTNIQIKTDYEENILFNGSPGAFAQIITNLLINALHHAYGTKERGIIKIKLENDKDKLRVLFKDDGCGMDAATLSKIYEPFFTTRRDYGGTGLGLSIVYSIVTQQFSGTIECKSVIGNGTTFNIIIPHGGT